eukprot:TRINITY_DN3065_c0_g1_i1.p1 TRINITY_DN3065_c0_g1~~TRINITY_DN3065_c0_g1_i1.p1  ORF type:complete len:451 (-),score=92.16 TRINITY_DN3065_c0_g1_i1:456-1808(-)
MMNVVTKPILLYHSLVNCQLKLNSQQRWDCIHHKLFPDMNQPQRKLLKSQKKSAVFEVKSIKDQAQVEMGLSSAISSKLFVYGQLFTKLVAQACIMSLPDESQNFDVDHIRVAKILGGSVNDSYVLHGLMIARNAEGCITRVEKPKVACYSQPLDPQNGDTKGTVLIKNAQDLLNYSKTEEELAENIVKKIADAGITLVVAGGSIAELIMHFLEKYRIMVVRITSKFDLQRICKALQAIPLARVDAPTPDEIGTCDECFVQEIGSQKVTIFKKQNKDCNLSTIVVRGSSNQLMDDIERGIEDGVNVYRNLLKDARYLPGAGSIEIKLSKTLEQEAKKLTDLNQYSYFRFGQSFEILPRILIENAGFNVNSLLPQLYTENQTETSGLDILTGQIKKVSDLKIYDHLQSKLWAIKLAADAAITVLKVDQIIIAKPAGGPKLPSKSQNWDEDQ